MTRPRKHFRDTEALARLLDPRAVYTWLVTDGYFPETYVLPPCFHVSRHSKYGKRYWPLRKGKFNPALAQICELHFPKSELTDRTFGIIDPKIHNEIAMEIADEWELFLDLLFHPDQRIYSYSFPVPVTAKLPGTIGALRAGRMIYEWIQMAENDLVEEAYQYKYVVKTDVKNFYPSVYTHSLAWAFHTKAVIRTPGNRYNYALLGNRLDKLFQNANDGCTNGLPIGPVVSDLMAEVVLSAVDIAVSSQLRPIKTLGIRFKDDYRFLCSSEDDCRRIVKTLQKQLKEFNLLLNEDKTEVSALPEGVFREWVSKYHAVKPKKKRKLSYPQFKEFYLSVLRIDKEHPGTGIIDKFIVDVTDKSHATLLPNAPRHIKQTISLLLLLASRRIKSFPKILGVIEAIMTATGNSKCNRMVDKYLNSMLANLVSDPDDNRYLISWILYFLTSNRLGVRLATPLTHPVLTSIQTNRGHLFTTATDFQLFRGIRATRKAGALLKHLDLFPP